MVTTIRLPTNATKSYNYVTERHASREIMYQQHGQQKCSVNVKYEQRNQEQMMET